MAAYDDADQERQQRLDAAAAERRKADTLESLRAEREKLRVRMGEVDRAIGELDPETATQHRNRTEHQTFYVGDNDQPKMCGVCMVRVKGWGGKPPPVMDPRREPVLRRAPKKPRKGSGGAT